MGLPATSVLQVTTAWRADGAQEGHRSVPEETAVALTYNRGAHAVMMATPADLADFATGFSLTEGIISGPGDIEELDIVGAPNGVELRMWIAPARLDALDRRRRTMAGPTGCGMCGLESLDQAMREPPAVGRTLTVTAAQVQAAAASLRPAQVLNRLTRAVHAAGFVQPGGDLVALREDVGRHNALDKLAGALARESVVPGSGIVVMTSRVSVELVQKLAVMGAELLVAVSAPTALALRVAERAGLTVAGVARDDGFEIFTHPWRIVDGSRAGRM